MILYKEYELNNDTFEEIIISIIIVFGCYCISINYVSVFDLHYLPIYL